MARRLPLLRLVVVFRRCYRLLFGVRCRCLRLLRVTCCVLFVVTGRGVVVDCCYPRWLVFVVVGVGVVCCLLFAGDAAVV